MVFCDGFSKVRRISENELESFINGSNNEGIANHLTTNSKMDLVGRLRSKKEQLEKEIEELMKEIQTPNWVF